MDKRLDLGLTVPRARPIEHGHGDSMKDFGDFTDPRMNEASCGHSTC